MGFLDAIFKRNSELGFMFDTEIFESQSSRVHMKKLAVETCISFLGRTISQSEFRYKTKDGYVKDELYYKLNVRPNKNMTASRFWEQVVSKLIYDNECLIIQTDDEDLLIADDYQRNSYAVMEDTFARVVVNDYEFKRTFKQSEVIFLEYTNEKLTPLIDGIFADYGELFGQILNSQKRKNQVRATVDMDVQTAKDPKKLGQLQVFIDNLYKSIRSNYDVAIVPQQPGFIYKEVSTGSVNQSVDEINKVTNGFLDQVAMAIGIPVGLLHGEMADTEKQTKNYMLFTVGPILKKIRDECDAKFIEKKDYLNGEHFDVLAVSYQNIFDLAVAIDKLLASGLFNRRELRGSLGYETPDGEEFDKFYITKNYMEEGAQNSEQNT